MVCVAYSAGAVTLRVFRPSVAGCALAAWERALTGRGDGSICFWLLDYSVFCSVFSSALRSSHTTPPRVAPLAHRVCLCVCALTSFSASPSASLLLLPCFGCFNCCLSSFHTNVSKKHHAHKQQATQTSSRGTPARSNKAKPRPQLWLCASCIIHTVIC